MWVLGVNWKLHDSSAALVDGEGRIWAMAEEERFTRVKHAEGTFPAHAARFCLDTAGLTWRDIDVVAMGWDMPRFREWHDSERQEMYAALFGPEAASGKGPELVFVEHHLAHALSAFHASGFDKAGVLVVDGSGEFESASIYAGDRASGLTLKRRWPRGYSLGAMYEATSRLLGFGKHGAGKTMGLAPYGMKSESVVLPMGDMVGDGVWKDKPPLDLAPDAPYDMLADSWMNYLTGRFGAVTRPTEQLDADPVGIRLAASAQRTVEEAYRDLYAETVCLAGTDQVCLSGGVALNCVANGKLSDPTYVPPFPHDAGVSLGAAWYVCPPKEHALLASPYLGTDLGSGAQELDLLRAEGFSVTEFSPDVVTDLLLGGAIGAVAEGRAEIGPRALGHRSIVAVPRPSDVRNRINTLKNREQWRPLAPVTLAEYAPELWPSQGLRERYMVGSSSVSGLARNVMSAATHPVDGTTRPQVVAPGQAPVVESLLHQLQDVGAPPVLVNTSFNGREEPVVDTAADAVRTFRSIGLDFLVLGSHLVKPGK
ncbi:carbamoyltransferase C-terminal domain-containing protein [Streptomyces sp. NPDC002769]|uniref:carbamoyltransferase C-terminal domain-containing protein n=1 Tax=Streptomyces sp. NPDC002769 TaxID=3154542 RepID=UPI00331B51B9